MAKTVARLQTEGRASPWPASASTTPWRSRAHVGIVMGTGTDVAIQRGRLK